MALARLLRIQCHSSPKPGSSRRDLMWVEKASGRNLGSPDEAPEGSRQICLRASGTRPPSLSLPTFSPSGHQFEIYVSRAGILAYASIIPSLVTVDAQIAGWTAARTVWRRARGDPDRRHRRRYPVIGMHCRARRLHVARPDYRRAKHRRWVRAQSGKGVRAIKRRSNPPQLNQSTTTLGDFPQ